MMPTFFDSTADAAEASEALRGLAHASRGFNQPAEMYGVIGDLSSGMRSLRQALDQIADVHARKAAHAFNDDGNHEVGVRNALAAAEELRQAANLVDRAYDRLAEGFIAAGRIAWHPEPAVEEAAPSRWVNVVFLQGEEADRPLRILGELGHVDAVDYLAQWDYGDETTQAALENGYVYNEPGEGTNDRVALSGDYALVVNPHLGYVSLLRRYTEPDAELQGAEPVEPSPAQTGPELLVSYSRIARGCTPPSWWHRRRSGGSSASSAARPRPDSTPSSEGPRSPSRRQRPRRSVPSAARRSTCRRQASPALRGCALRAGSI